MLTKMCSYCQTYHDESKFVKLNGGKFGQTKLIMCGPCAKARNSKKALQERLASIIGDRKGASSPAKLGPRTARSS